MDDVAQIVERTYREEGGRMLASLVKALRDLDLAEESLHDAMIAAVVQWPREGVPRTPRAWLLSVARRRAIDRLRRAKLEGERVDEIGTPLSVAPEAIDDELDERLRLFFTACHPALPIEGRIALTLRVLSGLSVPEIARAFLAEETAIQQRIVRAKRRIDELGLKYEVPSGAELEARLPAVLSVVYLLFNEGYLATKGEALSRSDLAAEAIRLGRVIHGLMPERADVRGLLALMLLTDARRHARIDDAGELVLLEDQDRGRWDRASIADGLALIDPSATDPYSIQASIASEHSRAPSAADTRWDAIAAHYDRLLEVAPSPVVALNRAVAVAMRDGPLAGLRAVEMLEHDLEAYGPFHAARADLLRRAGRTDDARPAYERAIALATSDTERRFLTRRRTSLG